MHQVSSANKSCRNTLITNARDQVAKGQKPDKTDNHSYCKARQRLTEGSIKILLHQSSENFDNASPESWHWHDRRVVITDDSTLSMPDTDANQKAYPQHSGQKNSTVIIGRLTLNPLGKTERNNQTSTRPIYFFVFQNIHAMLLISQ